MERNLLWFEDLFKAAAKLAKEKGLKALVVQTSNLNSLAHLFFQKNLIFDHLHHWFLYLITLESFTLLVLIFNIIRESCLIWL